MFRRMSAACMAALICICMTGCGESSVPYDPTAHHTNPARTEPLTQTTVTAETTHAEETMSPEEQAAAAVYYAEPVPVPAGGWTDETLLPVISVCGKPPEGAVFLSDLLPGYELLSGEKEYLETYADSIYVRHLLLHRDSLVMSNPQSDGTVPQEKLPLYIALGARWAAVMEDETQRHPFTVNTVGMDADFSMLQKYIDPDAEDPGEDYFRVHLSTEHFYITFTGENGIVQTISLSDNRE